MVLSNVNQAYIVKWLNKEKSKKSGEKFTSADVQGYVRRGMIPKYLGGNQIERVGENCKSYNIKE